jgi:glycyl-tRNA synthetase
MTRGLRNSGRQDAQLEVPTASEYTGLLEGARIALGVASRRDLIWRGAAAAAAEVGGTVPESARGDLLQEVTHLVEAPTVIRGEFNPKFLSLPRCARVLATQQLPIPCVEQFSQSRSSMFHALSHAAVFHLWTETFLHRNTWPS